jgi:hypothetical protein
MPDALSRWCLFCDAEVHSGARGGPRVFFENYVDDIIFRAQNGSAVRVYERENRVMRVADARRVGLPSGHPGIAMVITLGDRRGANPSFVHFAQGQARDPERLDGEVKGLSAHCIVELVEDEDHVGRHRMLIEDATAIGRTPLTRLLASELRAISKQRDERFRSPDTGGNIQLRPAIEVWPQKSPQLQAALETGRLGIVELYDTGRVAEFDELPEFRVKKRILRVEVEEGEGGFAGTLARLKALGRAQGYGNMKVSWRLPNGQVADSDFRTDLEDLGTALLARRELVTVETPMSDATDRLNIEFVEAMAAHFG